MSIKIEMECCGGDEKYEGQCLKDRCPLYSKASSKVYASWPFVSTGFGNLYGSPGHHNHLAQVKQDVKNKEETVE